MNAVNMTAAGGHLSKVLQFPADDGQSDVLPSPVKSIEALKASSCLVETAELLTRLRQGSFEN